MNLDINKVETVKVLKCKNKDDSELIVRNIMNEKNYINQKNSLVLWVLKNKITTGLSIDKIEQAVTSAMNGFMDHSIAEINKPNWLTTLIKEALTTYGAKDIQWEDKE